MLHIKRAYLKKKKKKGKIKTKVLCPLVLGYHSSLVAVMGMLPYLIPWGCLFTLIKYLPSAEYTSESWWTPDLPSPARQSTTSMPEGTDPKALVSAWVAHLTRCQHASRTSLACGGSFLMFRIFFPFHFFHHKTGIISR